MNLKKLSLLAWVPLSLLTSGCSESVDSTLLRTGAIYPEFEVLATGDGNTEVRALLRVGGRSSNTYADLGNGDALQYIVEGQTFDLRSIGDDRYGGGVSIDDGGTVFQIILVRGEDDEDADDSTVTLPEGFELSSSPNEVVRGEGSLQLTWTPAGSGEIAWEVDGTCIRKEDGVTADDGSLTLDSAQLQESLLGEGETCRVDVTMERVSVGTVDPAFDGGRIVAIQRRVVSFTSVPPVVEGMSSPDAGS